MATSDATKLGDAMPPVIERASFSVQSLSMRDLKAQVYVNPDSLIERAASRLKPRGGISGIAADAALAMARGDRIANRLAENGGRIVIFRGGSMGKRK